MSSRPDVVQQLLARPLPPLTPKALMAAQNPPYSTEVRDGIADLLCHPLLESVLHLMNDHLFAAHFLLRKMQEDEWGKWLHACLHLAEGDLGTNAKLWYEQVDPKVLSTYWSQDRFQPQDSPSDAAIKAMYAIQDVHAHKADAEQDQTCRQIKWDELVKIMAELEKNFGWEKHENGSDAYTRDEDPSHKSNVLGEGWRKAEFLPKT